jgi:aspartate/methionine/tyrosine aminotransferase
VALRAGVPPFYVMDVWLAAAERQRTHGDLVNLSAGQPSVGAPGPVRAAAKAALDSMPLGYTVALGIPELREAIASNYMTRYGIAVDADDVVATTGSSGGFLLAFLACFDVGDRVLVSSPGYPCYRNILYARSLSWNAGPRPGFSPRRTCSPRSIHRCVVSSSPAPPTPPEQ